MTQEDLNTPPTGDPPPNQNSPTPGAPDPNTPPSDPPTGDPPADPSKDTPPADPPKDTAPNPWEGIDEAHLKLVEGKTPAEIAKELANAQTLIGKKTIGIPTKESTPEEHAAFHEARGVPKTAADYNFDTVKEAALKAAPKGMEWDAAAEERFRNFARESNMSQGEAQEFLTRELQHRAEKFGQEQTAAAEIDKQTNDLVVEAWGNEQQQEANWAQVNRAAKHIGMGNDEVAAFKTLKGFSPETRFNLMEAMRKLGATLQEGGDPPRGEQTGANMTPEQAKAASDEFLKDADNYKAYFESTHPRHEAVSKYIGNLEAIARGIKTST